MILNLFISLLILLCGTAYAQEVIPSMDNQNIATLNDNFKSIADTSNKVKRTLTSYFGANDILDAEHGGTGADLSAATQDSVVYVSGTGVMGTIPTGTSGYILTSQGAGVSPAFLTASNIVAAYNTTSPITTFLKVGGPFADTGVAYRTAPFSRSGTVNVGFRSKALGGAATGSAYIRKNGVQVGTTRSLTSSYQNFTEDLAVSNGDYFELYVSACTNNCDSEAMWVSANNPSKEAFTSSGGGSAIAPIMIYGVGVPTNINCSQGDIYIRLDGNVNTLYVCQSANTWTAK